MHSVFHLLGLASVVALCGCASRSSRDELSFQRYVAACPENSIQKNEAGQPIAVRFDLKIESMARQPDGSLLIRATGRWDGVVVGFALESRPTGFREWSKEFCSDMSVQRIGEASTALDGILRRTFGTGSEGSIFKGFGCLSHSDPRSLERESSVTWLGDPWIEGKRDWSCVCFVDAPLRKLTFYVPAPHLREEG
jgi:hypothetical protein